MQDPKIGQRWLRYNRTNNYTFLIEIIKPTTCLSLGRILQIINDPEYLSNKFGYFIYKEYNFSFKNGEGLIYTYLEGQDASQDKP